LAPLLLYNKTIISALEETIRIRTDEAGQEAK
jgi:hypothetical protein